MIYRIVTILVLLLMFVMLIPYIRHLASGFISYLQNKAWRAGFLRLLAYVFVMIGFLIMAVSAMIPVILGDAYLTGVLLIIHVTIAPVFVGSIAFLMLVSSHSMRFNQAEWKSVRMRRFLKYADIWQKVFFWMFCTMAAVSAGSIILMLFPVFGTEGQEILLDIHRTASVLLVVTVSGHFWTYRPFADKGGRQVV